MTWTNLPADDSTDWSHVDFFNQFLAALKERQEAGKWFNSIYDQPYQDGQIGLGGASAIGYAGWHSIRTLQQFALVVCTYFQDPDTMSVTPGAIPDSFDFTAGWQGTRYTQQTAMDAAGLSAGFTRKRPREIEITSDPGTLGQRALHTNDIDRVYEHDGAAWVLAADQSIRADTIEPTDDFPRYIKEGDFIGPWLWNELQVLLRVPRVVVFGFGGLYAHYDVTDESDQVLGGSSNIHAARQDAIDEATGDWPDGGAFVSLVGGGQDFNRHPVTSGLSSVRFFTSKNLHQHGDDGGLQLHTDHRIDRPTPGLQRVQ